ncbi:MAG: efflux RND transporter periplasmic adaptor subunit [Bacteroidales bacterium]|nr:efflux RND transporter periplasmic adaptor subunit [Bacteroidales bacterium]
MAKKKKNIALRLALGALGLLVLLIAVGKKAGWLSQPERTQVFAEQPERRTIVESTNANGKIQPELEVKISSEVSGEITELPFKEGAWVERGQLLARIRPETYISLRDRAEAAMNSANAMLTQSQAQHKQQEAHYKRQATLHEQGAISNAEFEQAHTAFEVAKADLQAAQFNVASARASLKEANENLQKTSIYAPISGTISKLNVELGERVVGTMQMSGTEILRIANLNRMEARVNVNENDIVKVHLGDTAMVEVDAYLNRRFKGVVTQIANTASSSGSNTDQVTSFEVRVSILPASYADLQHSEGQGPFRPGMSTTVDILTNTKDSVLCIPIQAVTARTAQSALPNGTEQDAEKPHEVVFVVRHDTARMVQVQTGIQDNQHIEITHGLSPNDQVVTAPYSAISRKLADGALVTLQKSKDAVYASTSK